MWQNFPVQLKLKVTFHFDRYLGRPDQDQPNSWRQVLKVAFPKQAGADNFEGHRSLSLVATLSKWMMCVLVGRVRQHPRPDVHRGVQTVGFTQGWQTSAVISTVKGAFWHVRRCRCNVVRVSMDIHQCFDHMDTRRFSAALQARHLRRWLVRGVARELCLLKATARTSDAGWTPEFDFCKGEKTSGVATPALLNELLQHHLSSLAAQWHAHRTGYVIGGGEDDREMESTVLSHLCGADNMWLFASDTTTSQTMIRQPDPPSAQHPGYALETQEPPDHVRCTHVQKPPQQNSQLAHGKVLVFHLSSVAA